MARSMTITEAKIGRVLKAMVDNGIAVSKVDIMADRVVLLTDTSPSDQPVQTSKKIKNWTASPFDNKDRT